MLRLTASALVLALAACAPAADSPAEQAPAGTEAVVETESANPASPAQAPEGFQLEYALESNNYMVVYAIDQTVLDFDPALAYRFWEAYKNSVELLGVQADLDKRAADEQAAETGDKSWFTAYTMQIHQDAAVVLDDVISIEEQKSAFTGGAHPNYFLEGWNYRKGEEAFLGLDTFITDEAAFNELVIQALVAEKITRGYAATKTATIEGELREMLAPSPEIPNFYAGRFLLEESTEAGKIGGLSVLFSPYDVGSYAEGAYTVTLSAAELAPILTPEWAGKFGGEPVVAE